MGEELYCEPDQPKKGFPPDLGRSENTGSTVQSRTRTVYKINLWWETVCYFLFGWRQWLVHLLTFKLGSQILVPSDLSLNT